MISYLSSLRAAMCMLLISSAAMAQHAHEVANANTAATPGAHIHGVAELVVVLEGDQLEIEFLSPAVNILGFEHRAHTPEQVAILERTRETLAAADSLFQFDTGLCQITDHTADLGGAATAHIHNADGNDTDMRGTQQETHSHTNIEARYRYRCAQPVKLPSLTIMLPDQFPGIEVVQVQWVVGGRQGAITLDNDQRRILFR